MNAAELLQDLGRLGVRVMADGDKLRVRPASVIPPDLLEQVREHKQQILALLLQSPPPATDPASPWPSEIPALGPRTRGPFTDCLLCGPGRWVEQRGRVMFEGPDGEPRPVIGEGLVPLWKGHGTWAWYGGLPLCLHHARAWTETRSTREGARAMLHALLDVWGAMNEAEWTAAEVRALYEQIIAFWSEWPAAEGWWEEWRAAHPEARLC